MYNSLLTAGFPVIIADVLCHWYSKISFAVRWNSKLSARFAAGSGGAAGELFVASNIFKVFMNVFIIHLKLQRIGCEISSLVLGCLLYADDMILICPSVNGLQVMLDKCSEIAILLSL